MSGSKTKSLFNAVDVYDSTMPMYLLTYISGLTPVFSHTQSRISILFGYLFGIIHFSFYMICFVVAAFRKESIVNYFFESDLSRFGDLLQVCCGNAIVIIIFIFSYFKNTIASVLKIISNIDNEITKFGVNIQHKNFLKYSYFITSSILILNWSYYFGSYEILKLTGKTPSFEVYTSFCIPYIIMSLVLVKFIGSLRLISFRLSILNKVLETYLNRLKPDCHSIEIENKKNITKCLNFIKCKFSFDERFFYRLRDPIKLVMQIHNLLCDVSLILEDSLGYQMLAIISVSFLYILFDGYYILQVLVNPEINGSINLTTEIIAFFAIQLFLYVMVIVGITEASYSTMKENQQSLNYVHKIISYVESSNEKETLVALSLQLMNRDVRFSAAGLFYLDRALYFTIAGAITTYLIILIQFSSYQIPGIANLYNVTNGS